MSFSSDSSSVTTSASESLLTAARVVPTTIPTSTSSTLSQFGQQLDVMRAAEVLTEISERQSTSQPSFPLSRLLFLGRRTLRLCSHI